MSLDPHQEQARGSHSGQRRKHYYDFGTMCMKGTNMRRDPFTRKKKKKRKETRRSFVGIHSPIHRTNKLFISYIIP